jgi:hypothetical protein
MNIRTAQQQLFVAIPYLDYVSREKGLDKESVRAQRAELN